MRLSIHCVDFANALYTVHLDSQGEPSSITRSGRCVWNRHYRKPAAHFGFALRYVVRQAQLERAAQEG